MNFDDANCQFMQIHSGQLLDSLKTLTYYYYRSGTRKQQFAKAMGTVGATCDTKLLYCHSELSAQCPLDLYLKTGGFPQKIVPLYSQQACATASSWLTASEIMGSMIRQVGCHMESS